MDLTSLESCIDLEELGDIRERYPDDERAQDYALKKQMPCRYSTSAKIGPHRYTIKDASALDADIVVARHLLAKVVGSIELDAQLEGFMGQGPHQAVQDRPEMAQPQMDESEMDYEQEGEQ
ncbi:hypothetical protein F4804DRAFT_332375 [Jackrogersella minutella]|nr:hypothetical protein F4804DRAFT_332375 [Jackrogersella minutella]